VRITSSGRYYSLHYFNYRPSGTLQLEPWTYNAVPDGYWSDTKNHKLFFDWLGRKLQIEREDGWYCVSKAQLGAAPGAHSLLHNHYNDSFVRALMTVYPTYIWKPWLFEHFDVPRGYWGTKEHRQAFVQWLAHQLLLPPPSEAPHAWYSLTTRQVRIYKGGGLLDRSGSVMGLLAEAFPAHRWEAWRFRRVPNNTWKAKDGQSSDKLSLLRDFVLAKEKEIGISRREDWYRVSADQLRRYGLIHIIKSHRTLAHLLKVVYPDYNWIAEQFSVPSKKAIQRLLRFFFELLFPNQGSPATFITPHSTLNRPSHSIIV